MPGTFLCFLALRCPTINNPEHQQQFSPVAPPLLKLHVSIPTVSARHLDWLEQSRQKKVSTVNLYKLHICDCSQAQSYLLLSFCCVVHIGIIQYLWATSFFALEAESVYFCFLKTGSALHKLSLTRRFCATEDFSLWGLIALLFHSTNFALIWPIPLTKVVVREEKLINLPIPRGLSGRWILGLFRSWLKSKS